MRRALIRLYPAAWRERYGAELEALMLDVPAGWRGDFDVFKGAMGMRLKYQSGRGIVLGFVVAGILAGWLASYAVPRQWEATATMQITPAQIREPINPAAVARAMTEKVQRIQSNVTSRHSLANLIVDKRLDLYPDDRRTQPIEHIEDTMRSAIRIRVSATPAKYGAEIFTIAFSYPDRKKAQDVVNVLINRIVQEPFGNRDWGYFLDTLDPPHGPQEPGSPNRRACMAAGSVVGLVLAFAALLIRRRMRPPGPGLQPA